MDPRWAGGAEHHLRGAARPRRVDIKRIVAYSSISHLGFIVLGIFALNINGINGAMIQIVNHGIIIASLFLVVGYIEARTGTRDRRELAGLERPMPWLYGLFLVEKSRLTAKSC